MYEQLEKPKENKSRAVANSVAQNKGHGKQGLGFVDNRKAAIAQTKLTKQINRSRGNQATAQLRSAIDSSPVAQCIINVDGRDYGAGDEAVFEERYDERHRAGMLPVFGDLPHQPRSITAALADPRFIYLTLQEDDPEFGVFYGGVASALITDVDGGKHRVAAEIPELVLKPTAGFEVMDITGLIMCIGIVIEAKTDGVVEAASGGHFVTPSSIEEGVLNARGAGQLTSMVNLAKPHGALSATLCHAASADNIDMDKKRSTPMLAMTAINAIVSFLLSSGVSKVNILETGSTISYTVDSNGSRSLQ